MAEKEEEDPWNVENIRQEYVPWEGKRERVGVGVGVWVWVSVSVCVV